MAFVKVVKNAGQDKDNKLKCLVLSTYFYFGYTFPMENIG